LNEHGLDALVDAVIHELAASVYPAGLAGEVAEFRLTDG
jgi:hypothetical protein